MRTMLIPLIFICSLTQLESVQAGQISLNDDPYSYSCGTLYNCYVPEACVGVDATADYTAMEVREVTATTKIAPDCPAILRYHLYAKHWAHVIINSLQDKTKIQSIKFVQEEGQAAPFGEKLALSCTLVNDKVMIGRQGKKTRYENDKISAIDNLECEFHAKASSRNGLVVPSASTDLVYFEINPNAETLRTRLAINALASCDPTSLRFYGESSQTMIYKKIHIEPGVYKCNDPFEIEYNDAGNIKKIENIQCIEDRQRRKKFQLTVKESGTKILKETSDTIKIRCAAEPKYFCTDYNPKVKHNEKAPERSDPVWSTKTATKLKCPQEKPHLIITGESVDKTFKLPTFECQNFGSEQYWIVNENMLSKERPEIYCTDKLDCSRFLTIPTTQVKNGKINGYLPDCDANGKLNVDDVEVIDKGCNENTGQFYYSVVAGQQVPITDDTQFVCKYDHPDSNQELEEVKAAQTKLLTGGGIGAAVAAAVVCGAIAFGCFYFTKRRLIANEKKQKALEDATLLNYGMNKKEKTRQREINSEKRKKEKADEEERRKNTLVYRLLGKRAAEISSSVTNQPSSHNDIQLTDQSVQWNALMMSRMHEAHNLIIQDSRTGAKVEQVNGELLRDPRTDINVAASNTNVKRHDKTKTTGNLDYHDMEKYEPKTKADYNFAVNANVLRMNPPPKEEKNTPKPKEKAPKS